MNCYVTGDTDTLSLDPDQVYIELERQHSAYSIQDITLSDETGVQGYAKVWALRNQIQIHHEYPDYQAFGRQATQRLYEKILQDVKFVLILTRNVPSIRYTALIDAATRSNVPVRLALIK